MPGSNGSARGSRGSTDALGRAGPRVYRGDRRVYGTGKTTFALQLISKGLVRGETVIYISPEESEESIVRSMVIRGWEIEPGTGTRRSSC